MANKSTPPYIAIALKRVKSLDLDEMRRYAKTSKTITIHLETEREAKERKKKRALARVPIQWIVEAKEMYYNTNEKDEGCFDGFVSDWIHNWS